MTLFVGGPYDGKELPVASSMVEVRLPNPEEFAGYNPQATSHLNWPHVYRRARNGVFQYVPTTGSSFDLELSND